MVLLRTVLCIGCVFVSLARLHSADDPTSVAKQSVTDMGWSTPLGNEDCWQQLPVPKSGHGQPLPTWARMLAREMPKTTAAFLELDRAQRTAGPVPAKLRAAMRWVSARANHCDYALESARGDGVAAGISAAEWAGLDNGTFSGWNAGEQAALRFAHAMAVDSAGYSDQDFAALVAAFNERIVGSMVLHMAYSNFQDRLLICLGAPLEGKSLPAVTAVFDPQSLVSTTTPPPPRSVAASATEATVAVEDVIQDETSNTWLPYDQLQKELDTQRKRKSRLPSPPWSEIAEKLPPGLMDKPSKIVWYQLAFGYADELAVPFETYMRTAGSEIAKNWDRIFGNAIFWMVTDAMKCPYCMGHCEMNWEVAGLSAEEIAQKSAVLAGDDWSSFSVPQQHALAFARLLTKTPWLVKRSDMDALREGFGDQRALFIALNASRYNYMTRISNGFQLTLESENVFWDYYKMPAPASSAPPSSAPAPAANPNASDKDGKQASFIQPRATPVTRPEMKRMLEDMKLRAPRIPLPELTAEEKVKEKDDSRTYGYEGRLRSLYAPETEAMTYLSFSGTPANLVAQSPASPNARPRPTIAPDPVTTLGYPFKTRLFWIASRANNCQYCLGHQESKLLATGMLDDDLAALDTNWEHFPEVERVAFALARRMSLEPNMLSDADIEACRPHYTDLQIIEMIASVAGNNAINRWKEGIGVPQSSTGGNFGRPAASQTSPAVTAAIESHSYLTETSERFRALPSRVASLPNTVASSELATSTRVQRPELESRQETQKQLELAKLRMPRFPLADEDNTRTVLGDTTTSEKLPQWMRLVGHFPVAGKRLIQGVETAEKCEALSPLLKSQIAWVTARQDRAWYALGLARNRMLSLGATDDAIFALDDIPASHVSDADKALLVVAKNLAASPVVLTDAEVAKAVELAGPKATLQAIHYVAFRALFNRLTESAGLAIE